MALVVAETVAQVREFVAGTRKKGASVGFVPTMGALHAGHRILVRSSVASCDVTVVSIFVNPIQFGPAEDFDRYPKTREEDLAACRAWEVDLAFCPDVTEMYGQSVETSIRVRALTEHLCGAHRPGHFDGVCTVVGKLFNIVQPDRAFFGEKDYQQLAVVRRMVKDLSFPIEVEACPTLRDHDGVTVSSRNALLSPAARRAAASIPAALFAAANAVADGQREVDVLTKLITEEIRKAGAERVDYVSVVDAESLAEVTQLKRPARICVAAYFGGVRLIDNVAVDVG